MADDSRIPKLAGTSNLRSLPLDATDGFLLTRVDGRLSIRDLSAVTGVPTDSITRSLEKLVRLGAVEFARPQQPSIRPSTPNVRPSQTALGAVPQPPRAQPPPPPPPTPAAMAPPQPPPAPNPPAQPPPAAPQPPPQRPAAPRESALGGEAPRYNPSELEEEVDLDLEQKKRILTLYYSLHDTDYYTLLGIEREADKKAIKRAYYEFASNVHPDKFFRKNLGSFKLKMETVFGRLSEAHDTLTQATRRAEYDAYIGEVSATRGMEALLERALDEVRQAQQMPAAPTPVTYSAPPTSARAPTAAELQSRKDALARRLTGGGAPRNSLAPKQGGAPRNSITPGQSTPPRATNIQHANPQDAMDALKRRYEDRVTDAGKMQAKKYVDAGNAALAKKDVVAAANSFRVAMSFTPDDPELTALYEKAKSEAETILSESYLKQAQYEERSEHWTEAAKSWVRVAKIRANDLQACDRAAHAITKANGNLHEAAEYAKKAVELAPAKIEYRITLANVYLAAGLNLAAKRELEGAAQLDPKNGEVQTLLKRLQKAG